MEKKKTIIHIVALIIIIILIGGSFYGGMVYNKNKNTRFNMPSGFNGNFQGARNNTASGGSNIISGDIISKDDSSITVQLSNNGGSKIIFYSDATQITKSVSGSVDDLSTGISINITGTTNSDGSITAKTIQIRPALKNLGQQN
jgi:hypothetical protein